jgi:hypothetical protein
MLNIIPITKERIKKFNILGADISIGFAKYTFEYENVYDGGKIRVVYIEPVNYLYDHNEEGGIITHRLILWRVKIEVKSMVHYDYSFT